MIQRFCAISSCMKRRAVRCFRQTFFQTLTLPLTPTVTQRLLELALRMKTTCWRYNRLEYMSRRQLTAVKAWWEAAISTDIGITSSLNQSWEGRTRNLAPKWCRKTRNNSKRCNRSKILHNRSLRFFISNK